MPITANTWKILRNGPERYFRKIYEIMIENAINPKIKGNSSKILITSYENYIVGLLWN